MWFGFGIISLVSFSSYFAYSRWQLSWNGESGEFKNTPYQFKIYKTKYSVNGVRIGIKSPKEYHFAFRPEQGRDWWFKFLGITVEHQVGDKEFDDAVYVASDDQSLLDKLSTDISIRDTIMNLFNAASKWKCVTKQLCSANGRLWIHYQGTFNEKDMDELAQGVVPMLSQIEGLLSDIPLTVRRGLANPFVLKAAVFLGISTGFAITGAILLIKLDYLRTPVTIDSSQMFYDSIFIGLGFVLFLCVLVMVMLGRTARTHLVLIELILVGSLGAIGTVFGSMRNLNIEYDTYGAIVYEVQVLEKKYSRRRRAPDEYFIIVHDWTGELEQRKIEVQKETYRSINKNDMVTLEEHPGYLGYRWVDNVRNTNNN